MKAYRLDNFTSLDDLSLRDEDDPRPQRGEVLVRVHAVSLNFRGIAMLRGRYPLPHRKGLVPTSDGAGEVVEVGAGVDDFKVGDRVMDLPSPLVRRPDAAQCQPAWLRQRDRWLAARAQFVSFFPRVQTATGMTPLQFVTAGCGWVQREGGPIEEIRPGDVVWFPPGLKHWHGATPTTAMTHIAIQEQLDGKVVDWIEKVSDEQYRK